MRFSTKFKYFTFGVVSVSVLIPLTIKAVETIPVRFREGDVISASLMNQLFARVNDISKLPTASDLIGAWSCNETAGASEQVTTIPNSGWTDDSSQLFATKTNNYSFAATSNQNALLLTSTNGCPMSSNPLETCSNTTVGIAPQTRTLNVLIGVAPRAYYVTSVSKNRMEISAVGIARSVICFKTNTEPDPADGLSVAVGTGTATLSWTDQSSNESGFKIQYKTSARGNWTTATTAAANSTSYSVTNLAAGKYWFRVVATNNNGDAISSSEVQAEVQ